MNTYKTHNVCSRTIDFEIENNIVTDCKFNGGCPGNTQGVAALVKGMSVDEAIARLKGIQCRNGTSSVSYTHLNQLFARRRVN